MSAIIKVKGYEGYQLLTLPVPIPNEEKKLTSIFLFTLLCGASKGFMKALKVIIKPLKVPHISVKRKIYVNFYFNINFLYVQDGKGQLLSH